ncbi:MAG: ABC transporter permease [Oscillospiraceae bacterium]|nr:ABC transporter permease [Oscillospiraceae bacterium]
MVIGIKDVFKLIGMIIISACAVFVCTLFLNYNIDLRGIESEISAQSRALFDALVTMGKVISAVSGGCLLLTSVVMLCFYIKHYIDQHRQELGILKALGYSKFRIARGFWVFGLSVLIGTAIGFAGAHCLMPKFYSVQNEDGLLPAFDPRFHTELLLFLVILPTAAFALMSVGYGLIKLKTPVLELLKGKSTANVKHVRGGEKPTFLREMKSATVRSRKSLVFFIGFASFCYSAMVQMSLCIDKLASEMMALMTLMIGIILAFVTLFIAAATIVRSNAKSVSIMRVFGYSGKECSSAVLNGYRPAAVIGFAVGSAYQYLLLKIAVDVMFKDVENVPEFDFNFRALIVAAVSFVIVYEAVIFFCSRRLGKLSLKQIMLDAE